MDEATVRKIIQEELKKSKFLESQIAFNTAIGHNHNGKNSRGMIIASGFKAYLSSNQLNFTDDSWITVQFDTEDFDVNNDFNTNTYTFIAPATGYYYLAATVLFLSGTVIDAGGGATGRYAIRLFKNSTTSIASYNNHAGSTDFLSTGTGGIFLLNKNDTVVAQVKCDVGASTVDVTAGLDTSWFEGCFIGI